MLFSLFKGNYATSQKRWWAFNRAAGGSLPSYIPRELFSSAALKRAQQGTAAAGLSKVVAALKRNFQDDIARPLAQLETGMTL